MLTLWPENSRLWMTDPASRAARIAPSSWGTSRVFADDRVFDQGGVYAG